MTLNQLDPTLKCICKLEIISFFKDELKCALQTP